MRTLTIPKRSLFLRFFLWVWEANPEKLNVCKLFWGTVLFPMAFLNLKRKVYGFIPWTSSFFYLGVAGLSIVLGRPWLWTVVWFLFAGLFAVLGYSSMRISQSAAERREEKGQALSKITGRGSLVVELIYDHTIGLVADLVEIVADSRVGERVGGFFAVIGEYVRGVKHRLCPLVRVV